MNVQNITSNAINAVAQQPQFQQTVPQNPQQQTVFSNYSVRNNSTSYMIYANSNSSVGSGKVFGVVGLKPNGTGFEGMTIDANGNYVLQEYASVYQHDVNGNPVMGADGNYVLAYQPLNMVPEHSYTSASIYANRLALCLHYQKLQASKTSDRMVTLYNHASVCLKLWRAISFAHGKAASVFSVRQTTAYGEDAEATRKELECIAGTVSALETEGVQVFIKPYEELFYTKIETQLQNIIQYNGLMVPFVKGFANINGIQIKAEYSIAGNRELAIRQDPFDSSSTILVALKDAKYSKELMAGQGMYNMLRIVMPTRVNIVAQFQKELMAQRQSA